MTLGNMRRLGVQHLVAYCLRDGCRHAGLIDVSQYPADTEVQWFHSHMVCTKCGARGETHRCSPELERATTGAEPDRRRRKVCFA